MIEPLTLAGSDRTVGRDLDDLADILHASVEAGASVGFVTPFTLTNAREYWQGLRGPVGAGARVLLGARRDGVLVGTVQVVLDSPPNGRHRAEIAKLLVHPAARRGGLGATLMAAAEEVARAHGRTLLVLDTRTGDDGERLYRRIGYEAAGVIPRYARASDGDLEDTIYMFKELS
ncbi:GNAT family N-acetyltransferase [Luedemannella flava]|uniref:GNAT family N-acetyltransferase n=1 Tax=Luedemannella flava TaxID=349316 RepID=UPI0031E3FAB4